MHVQEASSLPLYGEDGEIRTVGVRSDARCRSSLDIVHNDVCTSCSHSFISASMMVAIKLIRVTVQLWTRVPFSGSMPLKWVDICSASSTDTICQQNRLTKQACHSR